MEVAMYTNTIKPLRNIKLIQLAFTIVLSVCYFMVLKLDPEMEDALFNNSSVFLLSCTFWALLLASYLFLILDLIRLRSLNTSSHELNKLAYLDDLTGIPNRYSCDLIFKMYRDSDKIKNLGCAILEISNLTSINLHDGYEAGSIAVKDFCNILEIVGEHYGFVGRNSGNEFLAVIEDCDEQTMKSFLADLQRNIHDYNEADHPAIEITYAYSLNSIERLDRFAELITRTYQQLHTK